MDIMSFGDVIWVDEHTCSVINLMNDVFREYLDKCVIVFNDDILIYSWSREEHVEHLQIVFGKLIRHQLFTKQSKSSF